MQDEIERDIKSALLAGDKEKAETLRTLKSAILNEAIAKNQPRENIGDDLVETVLRREAKKRQEAAELYSKAGEDGRAKKEATEKELIDGYLPQQMSDEEVKQLVSAEISALGTVEQKDMGKIIAAVRVKSAGRADGALIARLVREELG